MAYPVVAESGGATGVATYTQPIPAGHQANDLLLAIFYQDTGTTAFSALGSGWSFVNSPAQAAEQGQRTHVAWKIAASSSEADFTVTGMTEDWECVIAVIRGADTTTPIAGAARAGVTGATPQAGSYTVLNANALLVYAFGQDNGNYNLAPTDPGEMVPLGKSRVSVGGTLLAGYRNQAATGAAARPTLQSLGTAEGGSFWTIEIKDDGNAKMGPDCRVSYEVLRHHGQFAAQCDTAWSAITAISALSSASIDGMGCNSTAPSALATATSPNPVWNDFTPSVTYTNNPTWTVNLGSDAWVGATQALSPAKDMTGKTFFVRFGSSFLSSSAPAKGFIVVFEDGGGNWAAFRLSQISGLLPMSNGQTFHAAINLQTATPLASGGTMNWANVARFGYAMHRNAGLTSSRTLIALDAYLSGRAQMVGGSASAPITPASLEAVMNGWSDNPLVRKQSTQQVQMRSALQFGDGSTATYVDISGASIEFPPAFDASFAKRFWQCGANGVDIRIKASASDTMRVRNAVIASDTRQSFVIDSGSSASAIYDFAGLVVVGLDVTNNVSGIALNGATFRGCYEVTLNGGSMSGCRVSQSLASSAVKTTDPSKISGCTFTQGNAGHAIEITTPGTYTFSGNTFSGYGIAGSTDAAIYNNSGGAVTLNITGGGSTPTVRNGASASTTVNNNVTISLQNVVSGSSIRVEKVSDGSLVEFRTAATDPEDFAVPASVNYRVKVRKASGGTLYKPYDTQTGSLSDDTSIYVSQIPD